MSKTSYALLTVIITALLYMGAVRLREWQSARQAAREAQLASEATPFSFQQLPISLAAPQARPLESPVRYMPAMPEIYLEDAPLAPQLQDQQAQETISSILDDFNQIQAMADFNQELQQVSNGQVQGLEDLSTQNLAQIVQQNPEISHVVEKHLKNQDFAKAVEEIFANPQFQQSVRQLQGQSPAVQTP